MADLRRHLIIGTGAIAGAHASAVAAFPGRSTLEFAVDLDADRARDFAGRHGIAAWGTDLAAALDGPDGPPDVAHICTPPGSHVPLAIQCLEAGTAVLLEKPPALSLAEVDRLLAVSDATGTPVSVVFQHRFGAGAHRVRRLLGSEAPEGLGRALVATCETLWFRPDAYFEVPWRGKWEVEGGGPTMGHGIHQFDLLLSLLGSWDEVTALAGHLARPTATEDVSMAVVRFADGAMASVVNSLLSPRETSLIRLDTERATVEVEHLYGYTDEHWRITAAPGQDAVADAWRADVDETARTAPETVASGHTAQLSAILDALDAGEVPPVSLRDARETLELVAAIYASAFTGGVVRRGEIGPGHPFYERMEGTGAPWRTTVAAATRVGGAA
ncbi:Gfo/Idh/MocA family oxidoreductase [Actinotalea ferrariae]|uniref:Gfo/Idh/MocA family protein n=1 Tax=Actinotalea ferrariae TaxID=1386098 RepID=UPI001C8BB4D2|nr:Gfo/Idh/MocA family oxidoreductase [Actinotalea ferrariae]MBX9243688.1 Gfo/Idh/MocA family oxidoreductase [Actinotalea ferrariae]